MDNLIEMVDNKDYQKLAVEKIDKELKEFKGDRYGEAVKTYVANILRDFCSKNADFAKVVYRTKRTLSDCIASAMKGCGTSISDIEVYRRTTKFYFPDSEVNFNITITTGEAPDEKYIDKQSPKHKETKAAPAEKKEAPKKEAPQETPNVIQMSLF